jgi:hypothetical protein
MRKQSAILFLMLFMLPFTHGQKTRFGPAPPRATAAGDYPIKVHISGIHIRSHCSEFKGPASCRDVIYADSVINEKRIELMGDRIWLPTFSAFPVQPGDYKARMAKEAPNTQVAPLDREYELVLPDETVWRCTVTGFTD